MILTLTYGERAIHCTSVLSKKIFNLLAEKKTNLALSADVTEAEKLLALANQLGPEIAILKTHIDIIDNFTPALTKELSRLAKQHQFFIFEDRKFADIGNTVKHQYQGGIYRIAEWADIINAHSLPGPGIIRGLQSGVDTNEKGLLLLAEMSSQDNLLDKNYRERTLQMAEAHREFVIGFISQHAISPDPKWIYMTPGVQCAEKSDSLGQQYITPEKAILENGTDIIIVGRGIIQADNPLRAAQQYRAAAWNAYEERCRG